MPDPEDMTMDELIDALDKNADEHDLDCEEGGPKDRCLPCLAEAAKKEWHRINKG